MLLVGFEDLGQMGLSEKYPDKINVIIEDKYDKQDEDWIIKYIEDIEASINLYDVTYISYNYEVISCLQVLNIDFKFIYTGSSNNLDLNNVFKNMSNAFLLDNHTLEWYLKQHFDWVISEDNSLDMKKTQDEIIPSNVSESDKEIENKNIENNNVTEDNKIISTEDNGVTNDSKTTKVEDKQNNMVETVNDKVVSSNIPDDKNKLTMEQLLQDDVEITETDVRDLKATSNKLKVGMLLQAKTSLKRVLKLSNTLDKLYDELLNRVDNSLNTTDTASLMYTTEYIAKALNDTNQFIVSLINNEKIQNFFIVDNSSIVNIGSINNVDIDKREKIRKAAEIVMDNIDYFVEGDYSNMKNPNVDNVKKENKNAN